MNRSQLSSVLWLVQMRLVSMLYDAPHNYPLNDEACWYLYQVQTALVGCFLVCVRSFVCLIVCLFVCLLSGFLGDGCT